jgi:hypothetical protein
MKIESALEPGREIAAHEATRIDPARQFIQAQVGKAP